MRKSLKLLAATVALATGSAAFASGSVFNLPSTTVHFNVNAYVPNTTAQVSVKIDPTVEGNSQNISLQPNLSKVGSINFPTQRRYLQVSVPAGIGGKNVAIYMKDAQADNGGRHPLKFVSNTDNSVSVNDFMMTGVITSNYKLLLDNSLKQVDAISSTNFGKKTPDIEMVFTAKPLTPAEFQKVNSGASAKTSFTFTIQPVLNT